MVEKIKVMLYWNSYPLEDIARDFIKQEDFLEWLEAHADEIVAHDIEKNNFFMLYKVRPDWARVAGCYVEEIC